MQSNSAIVNDNIKLIKTCVWYQCAKYKVPAELQQDIVQDICLILLEYNNICLNSIVEQNHLNAFITGILKRQLYSTCSKVYKKYRRHQRTSVSIDEFDFDYIDDNCD